MVAPRPRRVGMTTTGEVTNVITIEIRELDKIETTRPSAGDPNPR